MVDNGEEEVVDVVGIGGCNLEVDVGSGGEEDIVFGNNSEVDGIQTDDSPVDAQIGSWVVVDDCQRKHGVILVEVDDVAAAGGADPMVKRQKFPGWVVHAGSIQTVNLVLATE